MEGACSTNGEMGKVHSIFSFFLGRNLLVNVAGDENLPLEWIVSKSYVRAYRDSSGLV